MNIWAIWAFLRDKYRNRTVFVSATSKMLASMTFDRNEWRKKAIDFEARNNANIQLSRELNARLRYRETQVRELQKSKSLPINIESPKIAFIPMYAEFPFPSSIDELQHQLSLMPEGLNLTEIIKVVYEPGQKDL